MATRVVSTIDPDYAAGTATPQVIDGIATTLAAFQSALGQLPSQLQQYCVNTLLAMYNIDQQGANSNAPLSQLVSGSTVAQAMAVLINQMNTATTGVQTATVTVGSAAGVGSPNGTPVFVSSVKNVRGIALQLCLPETLLATCIRDSQGGAPLGNEVVQVTGQASVSDVLSHLWPGGSASNVSLTAVSGATNNSSGNLLYNSDFRTYSNANLADQFVAGLGTVGTAIINSTRTTTYPTWVVAPSAWSATAVRSSASPSRSARVGLDRPRNWRHAGHSGGRSGPPRQPVVQALGRLAGGGRFASLADGRQRLPEHRAERRREHGQQRHGDALDDSGHQLALSTVCLQDARHPADDEPRLQAAHPLLDGALQRHDLLSLEPHAHGAWHSCCRPVPVSGRAAVLSIHSGAIELIAGLSPDQFTLSVSNNYGTSGNGLLQQMFDRTYGLRSLGLQLPIGQGTTLNDSVYLV